MKQIATIGLIRSFSAPKTSSPAKALKRKSYEKPAPSFQFAKSVRLDFISNPRLASGTKNLLMVLLTLDGNRSAYLKTTVTSLAKILHVSVDTIQRYLKDAQEEGYLVKWKRAGWRGMIEGVNIWLNHAAMRRQEDCEKDRNRRNTQKNGRKPVAVNLPPINTKHRLKGEKSKEALHFEQSLNDILRRNGLDPLPI